MIVFVYYTINMSDAYANVIVGRLNLKGGVLKKK